MSKMQSPDEGDQRAHLPQAAEVEVPEVRQGQDAEAEVTREYLLAHHVQTGFQDRDASVASEHRTLRRAQSTRRNTQAAGSPATKFARTSPCAPSGRQPLTTWIDEGGTQAGGEIGGRIRLEGRRRHEYARIHGVRVGCGDGTRQSVNCASADDPVRYDPRFRNRYSQVKAGVKIDQRNAEGFSGVGDADEWLRSSIPGK